MPVVVSSAMTFFYKFVFPTLWGGLWSYGTACLFVGESVAIIRGRPEPWGKWVFLAALVLGGAIFRYVAYPLKRVIIEEKHLRISNYVREITVPFTEVEGGGFDVSQINSRSVVVLSFRHPTAFGRSIKFLPRSSSALELLRARLTPELGVQHDPGEEAIASEIRGRGTA